MSLKDRYELLAEAGGAAPAGVRRALDRRTGREVVVRDLVLERPRAIPQELVRLAGFAHPCIQELLDVVAGRDRLHLVFESLDGETLADRLARLGRLPAAEALTVIAQLARGLAGAHARGLVHGALAPEHVTLTMGGGVKIGGFRCTLPEGERGGNAAYRAPEAWAGEEPGPPADLWAAGVLLYRCLTGRRPFLESGMAALAQRVRTEDAPPPSRWLPDLAGGVDRVTARVLSRDPAARPASGDELADALLAWVPALPAVGLAAQDEDEGAEPVGRLEEIFPTPEVAPPAPGARRRGLLGWAVAAAAALLVLAAATAWALRAPPAPVTAAPRPSTMAARSVRPVPAPAAEPVAPPVPAEEMPGMVRPLPAADVPPAAEPAPARPAPAGAAEPAPAPPVQVPARAERPEPRPAALLRPAAAAPAPAPAPAAAPGPAAAPATAASPAAADGRLVIELRHDLPEGRLEIRLDGRRVAFQPLVPGAPAIASVTAAAGSHRVVVRVLSAEARVTVEDEFALEVGADGLATRRMVLEGKGSAARLARYD